MLRRPSLYLVMQITSKLAQRRTGSAYQRHRLLKVLNFDATLALALSLNQIGIAFILAFSIIIQSIKIQFISSLYKIIEILFGWGLVHYVMEFLFLRFLILGIWLS